MSTCRWHSGRLAWRAGGKSRPRRGDRSGLMLQSLEHEEGIGQHHQCHVAMQSFPGASLKLVQPTFPFGIFVELLNRPAQMGERYQAQERRIGRQRAKEPTRLAVLSRKRTLPEQPAFWTGPAPSVGLTVAGRAGSC